MERRALIRVVGLAWLVGGSLTAPAWAETTLERVKREGTVRIGFANEAPYSYTNPDGTMAGVDYDLAVLIFSKLGVATVDGVPVKFGSLIPGLKAKRFDLVGAGMAIRPQRCEQVAFSEPNLQVGDAVIVKAGNPHKIHSFPDVGKNPELKLGGVLGGVSLKNAVAAGALPSQVVEFPHWSEAVAAVKAGRLAGAVQSSVAAQRTLADANDPSIERAQPFATPVVDGKPQLHFFGFAFRPEDKDLLVAYNKEFLALRGTEEHLKLLRKYGLSASEIPPAAATTAKACSP
jgi:polar amino acid transport system substrate-binding protein